MKSFKRILMYLICFPSDLLGYFLTILVWLFFGTNLHWDKGLWCELKKSSWFYKKYYKGWGGTTLGRGGFYGPGKEKECKDHEQFHVRQYTSFLIGFYIGLFPIFIFSFKLGIITSLLGYIIWYISGIIEAFLSNNNIYRGNENEIAAYNIDKLKEKS